MKVRIVLTFDLTDDDRRAINAAHGDEGLASREQCVSYLRSYAATAVEALGPISENEAKGVTS